MPDHSAGHAGLFRIGGELEINRLGYGAMRLNGADAWGEPANRQEAINLYSQIQTTLLHDSRALFLGTQTYERVMQKSVGGFVDNPAYPSVVFVYSLHPGQ